MNLVQEDGKARAVIWASAHGFLENLFLNVLRKIGPYLQRSFAKKFHGHRPVERPGHHRSLRAEKNTA
jgi:hypothetical protein